MTHEFGTSYHPELEMRKKDVPCWYEISLGEKAKYLQLKIHPDFIQNSRYQLDDNRSIEILEKRFDLHEFGTDFNKDIGFGKVLENIGSDKDGMIVYQISIPRIRTLTDQKCSLCHGHDSTSCQICNGAGREFVTTESDLYPISASLTIITSYLATQNKPTSASYPQLLTLSTFTDDCHGGGAFSGNISLKLHTFLRSQTQEQLDTNIFPAMKEVTRKLFGENSREENSTEFAFLKKPLDGTISIGCFGYNSCGIGADDSSYQDIENGFGYKFNCHNVDKMWQQITLIAGLAALHDAARKEI